MAHFDDTSGVVSCNTNWGQWWQTMDDVCIEMNLEEGTAAKFVQCDIKPKRIKVVVKGQTVVEVGIASGKRHSVITLNIRTGRPEQMV